MRTIKTIRGLASEIAKREGNKNEDTIGNIREILAILSDIFHEHGTGTEQIFYSNGSQRARRNRKKHE